MKFIKMAGDCEGCSFTKDDKTSRYVRADIFDEIIISWNGDERPDEAIYTVEGINYKEENRDETERRFYDIEYFDTYADAQAYLDKLIAELNHDGQLS